MIKTIFTTIAIVLIIRWLFSKMNKRTKCAMCEDQIEGLMYEIDTWTASFRTSDVLSIKNITNKRRPRPGMPFKAFYGRSKIKVCTHCIHVVKEIEEAGDDLWK